MITIRAGKANPAIFNNVTVDYYGAPTPLPQVSSITSPDAKTIFIQPWDKKMIAPIEKAIMAANLGFTPQNNGEQVRINIPPLTEERRKELVKQVKGEGETARISIRNARRDGVELIKKYQKDGLPEDVAKDNESELQKLTDSFNKKADEIIEKKEKEIMTV
jgi:ribosome recycling factor